MKAPFKPAIIRLHIILFGFLLVGLSAENVMAQTSIKWWNPGKEDPYALQGQGWHKGLASPYDRLPMRIKSKLVRKPVWRFSQDPAGVIVRFRSNAREIHVRYQVEGRLSISHMAATAVSGVGLYALSNSGKWEWAAGTYDFGDTITYDFAHLKKGPPRSYYLYLPLYNEVKWLEIGVADSAIFRPEHYSTQKPIVVYGTSIAQGIAAPRPGLAWPAILGRKLHMPVINLGFSGNGRLEAPMINLISELNPRLYILACMPNMWYSSIPSDTVRTRLLYSVRTLKKGILKFLYYWLRNLMQILSS